MPILGHHPLTLRQFHTITKVLIPTGLYSLSDNFYSLSEKKKNITFIPLFYGGQQAPYNKVWLFTVAFNPILTIHFPTSLIIG